MVGPTHTIKGATGEELCYVAKDRFDDWKKKRSEVPIKNMAAYIFTYDLLTSSESAQNGLGLFIWVWKWILWLTRREQSQ